MENKELKQQQQESQSAQSSICPKCGSPVEQGVKGSEDSSCDSGMEADEKFYAEYSDKMKSIRRIMFCIIGFALLFVLIKMLGVI